MATQSEDIPSVKDLASSDPPTRRRALTLVLNSIATRSTPPTPTQSLQIWKGLFYALYMHDSKSPISVQNLVFQLAAIIRPSPSTENAGETSLALTEAFWITICREWAGLDVHRMDKYLLLVRMVVREVFGIVLAPASVTEEQAERQITFLSTYPLSPRERKVPDGLRYHVLDIYVDELERTTTALDGEDEKEKSELRNAVLRLLGPVETLAKEGMSKSVRVRAKDALADERVSAWKDGSTSTSTVAAAAGGRGDGGDDGDEEWEGLG